MTNSLIIAGIVATVAVTLIQRYWPWDWRGKRKYLKIKTRRKDWE